MDSNFYFKDVHSEWVKAIENCGDSKVIILSPYLTPKLALTVIESTSTRNCRIYTRCSLQDFASGSSSIEVVRTLIKKGYKIYEISKLHAKVVVVSGKFASIGSQNMTENGKNNLEATFFSFDADFVLKVEKECKKSVKGASLIDIKIIEEIEAILPTLKSDYSLLDFKCSDLEDVIRNKIKEIREKEKSQDYLRKACKEALSKIEAVLPNNQVSLEMARNFIRVSAFSSFNRNKALRPAPGYERHVFGENYQWKLERGSNTFLISEAIIGCKRILVNNIRIVMNGYSFDPENLIKDLRENIQRSVLNVKGIKYQGLYPVDETNTNDMMFGNASIDIKLFIRESLDWLPFQLFIKASKANNEFS